MSSNGDEVGEEVVELKFKSQPCSFYAEGSCKKGDLCTYAHGDEELAVDMKSTKKFSLGGGRAGAAGATGQKRSADAANLTFRPCKHFINGDCRDGENCKFSHDLDQFKKSRPPTYKTILCTNYMGHGHCKMGEACGFAHGRYELRPVNFSGDFEAKIKEKPTWKTELCAFFQKDGACRNSTTCDYAHGLAELREFKQSHIDGVAQGAVSGERAICKYFALGSCKNGNNCLYAHGQDPGRGPSQMGYPMDGVYHSLDYSEAQYSNDVHVQPTEVYQQTVMPQTVYAEPVIPQPDPIENTNDLLQMIATDKDTLYSEFLDFLHRKISGNLNPPQQPQPTQQVQTIRVPVARSNGVPQILPGGATRLVTVAQPVVQNGQVRVRAAAPSTSQLPGGSSSILPRPGMGLRFPRR